MMMMMMLAAMVVLAMAVPLLPALLEWRRPSDVVPLAIDETDALDPPYLAHSFAARLASAVRSGATEFGGTELVAVATDRDADGLPLQAAERSDKRSDRVWHVTGHLNLPQNVDFYSEVAASGSLRTASHSICRALWAGETAVLSTHTTVLRWAHAEEVQVATGCHLAGRVTAQRQLSVAPGVHFMLLHAPRIAFMPLGGPAVGMPSAAPAPAIADIHWPADVDWNPEVRRAMARQALTVAAGRGWRGDVVCLSDLELGAHCRADGSLKARGALALGRGCHVSGSVVAGGAIELEADCVVRGSVVSESLVVIGPGCTVGAPHQHATVSAPQIRIAPGVVVHGTVWAASQGTTLEDRAA